MIKWEINGREMLSCNCASGCPCQFNALPTQGHCEGVFSMDIDQGRFGDVPLDGLRAVAIMSWPGAIHQGGGKALIVVDQKANQAQREALLKIMAGEETEPGATVFNVFAATLEKVFDPVFKPIQLDIDVERRRGEVKIDGIVDVTAAPVTNPVTGQEHRARINLPNGFEFRVAEVGKSSANTRAPVQMSYADTHAHFATLHMTQSGVIG